MSTLTEHFRELMAYDTQTQTIVPFRKKMDKYQNSLPLGFSNMDGDYPIVVGQQHFCCVETAYICASYGLKTQESAKVQRMVRECKNGFNAKRQFRHNPQFMPFARTDFDTSDWRYHFMLSLVWRKCLVFPQFAERLKALPKGCIIVEDSPHDGNEGVWGCRNDELEGFLEKCEDDLRKKYGDTSTESAIQANLNTQRMMFGPTNGIWRGQNVQGKILTICKEAIEQGTKPAIDTDMLNEAEIYWFGRRIRF